MKKASWPTFWSRCWLLWRPRSPIDSAGADLAVQALFYSPGAGWALGDREPWAFLYHFGNLPAFALGAMGVIAFVLSFFVERFRPDRVAALFVVVLLALGPGLIVNTVFKDHWGRPRPADIVQFGGTETYRSFWHPGPPEQGRSFPSGHAAVGFSPHGALLRAQAQGARLGAKGPGGRHSLWLPPMGLGRMIQGGHFLTDVIWSGCMVYFTGLFLYYLFRLDREGLA